MHVLIKSYHGLWVLQFERGTEVIRSMVFKRQIEALNAAALLGLQRDVVIV